MKNTLRDYQKQAISRILWSLTFEGGDLVVLPTGSGKSHVIAALAHKLNKPILILQPSREILTQNYEKLARYVDTDKIGIYSAGLNQKEIKQFTFATIQSVYKKPEEFKHFGLVIVDECHAVNPKNLDGMFTTFLKAIGNPKVIGLTATPYRMDLTYIWQNGFLNGIAVIKLINRTKAHFWHRLIFNINNADLVKEGYLVPLDYIDHTLIEHKDIPTNKSLSDFDLQAYEQKISAKEQEIIRAISYAESTSKSVLVFCTSINQATKLNQLIASSRIVTGTTPAKERTQLIEDFKNGTIQTVLNVGVLTTGFDHPSLDCIVLLRPTRSIALYYQMLGRGVRIAEGKTSCKVIDLSGTVKQLGRIETIKLEKINQKWELISETGSWHNRPLYAHAIQPKKKVYNMDVVLNRRQYQ